MRATWRDEHTQRMDLDALVELPTFRPAPAYEPRGRRSSPAPKRRATLLDRLVSTAGVDHVTIDLTALERDLDALRAR